MDDPEQPVVLVVDDDPDVAAMYARWLDDYAVRIAESGAEALETLDETVDVVLLDRRMPGLSGADVLEAIRSRDVDCRVAMVTAVKPGFDIIEMGLDEYIRKPTNREKLIRTIDRLLDRATLADSFQAYYSLVARRAALETEFAPSHLGSNEEYADLLEQIETQRAVVDDATGDLTSTPSFLGAIRVLLSDFE